MSSEQSGQLSGERQLQKSVERRRGIDDGEDYIEKIDRKVCRSPRK
jgi:hypothetical protein